MKLFIRTIKDYVKPSSQFLSDLAKCAEMVTFAADQHILTPAAIQTHIYFIEEGVAISRYDSHDNQSFVNWIVNKGNLIVSIRSFQYQVPAQEYITACTDLSAVAINKEDFEILLQTHPSFNSYIRIVTGEGLLYKDQRLFRLLMLNAYERYCRFVEERPDMINRLKGSDIADYLGITPSTLSKIRKKYRDEAVRSY